MRYCVRSWRCLTLFEWLSRNKNAGPTDSGTFASTTAAPATALSSNSVLCHYSNGPSSSRMQDTMLGAPIADWSTTSPYIGVLRAMVCGRIFFARTPVRTVSASMIQQIRLR